MKTFRLLLITVLLGISFPTIATEKIIGILDIPSIYPNYLIGNTTGDPTTDQLSDRRFNLREKADRTSKVLKVLSSSYSIRSREFDYELSGALVYDHKRVETSDKNLTETWYKIYIGELERFGWINMHSEMTYHSIFALLRGLSFSDSSWDGYLIDSPRSGAFEIDTSSFRTKSEKRSTMSSGKFKSSEELPAYETLSLEVLKFDEWDGHTWALVVLFSESECETDAIQPRVIGTGWMRLYSDSNNPNLWFYSRGC